MTHSRSASGQPGASNLQTWKSMLGYAAGPDVDISQPQKIPSRHQNPSSQPHKRMAAHVHEEAAVRRAWALRACIQSNDVQFGRMRSTNTVHQRRCLYVPWWVLMSIGTCWLMDAFGQWLAHSVGMIYCIAGKLKAQINWLWWITIEPFGGKYRSGPDVSNKRWKCLILNFFSEVQKKMTQKMKTYYLGSQRVRIMRCFVCCTTPLMTELIRPYGTRLTFSVVELPRYIPRLQIFTWFCYSSDAFQKPEVEGAW